MRAGEPRYEARQALERAMRHLREAEDIARLEIRDDHYADRVREIHELLTSRVLRGRRDGTLVVVLHDGAASSCPLPDGYLRPA